MESLQRFSFLWDEQPTPIGLKVALYVCGAVSVGVYFVSIINKNYSQVDRLWSILPVIYAWIFTYFQEGDSPVPAYVSMLITIWGARLTYNYWRKGGYKKGEEDYRWKHVQKRFGTIGFQLLNITFISVAQNVLLLLITIPVFLLASNPNLGILTNGDFALALIFTVLLFGETTADNQQWNFQAVKYKKSSEKFPYVTDDDLKDGFIQHGLFSYSRHFNFFCEQSMWWCISLFPLLHGEPSKLVSCLGAFLLTLLFNQSTQLTEEISATKYPKYRQYKKQVPRFVPYLGKLF